VVHRDWLRRPTIPLLLLPLLSGTRAAALAAGAPHSASISGTHWSLLVRGPGGWFHYDSLPGEAHAIRAIIVADAIERELYPYRTAREPPRAIAVPPQSEARCGLYTWAYAADLARGQIRPGAVGAWTDDRMLGFYLPVFRSLLAGRGRPGIELLPPGPPPPPSPRLIITILGDEEADRRRSDRDVRLIRAVRDSLLQWVRPRFNKTLARRGADRIQWDNVRDWMIRWFSHPANQWPQELGPRPDADEIDILLELIRDDKRWFRGIGPEGIVELFRAWEVHNEHFIRAWQQRIAAGTATYDQFHAWSTREINALLDLTAAFGVEAGEHTWTVMDTMWFCCHCGRMSAQSICGRDDCKRIQR